MEKTWKATSSKGVSIVKNKETKRKKWEDLEYDVLLKIFASLNLIDVIMCFSRVCCSWRSVCYDPVLWGTLDLTLLNNYFNIPSMPGAWIDRNSSQRLMLILRNAVNLGRENIHTLIYHFYIFIRDDHLICAAQRCPNVKRLVLPALNLISVEGFGMAVQNWRGLESMLAPCLSNSNEIFKLIRQNCENFSELKVMCQVDLEFANSITKYLPRLKKLSLRCGVLHSDALEHLLDNLEHLEALNVSHCLLVYVPSAGIFVYRKICSALLKKASRLREFHSCESYSCPLCRHGLMDEDGVLKCHEFEEGLWRNDEVSSLAY